MSGTSRRDFLATSAGLAASGLLAASARAQAPSERFRIGVIGSGNQGSNHQNALTRVNGIEIAYVCDVDETRLAAGVERTKAKGVTDLRKVLDDPNVDGVTIALPDHWHVPAALLALEAGKHVYLEKPAAHNFREMQMLLAAAKKSDKTVQHGTQARSTPGMQQAMGMLHDGLIGDVLIAKCWNWQKRNDIGHDQPTQPPAGVDYDTWVGPAEWLPFQKNRFHYEWHWWFNFGTGDMGNDGIHELDYAIWGLGVKGAPTYVSGNGGIYHFKDDRQWPDTQQVNFEYITDQGPRMLIYEQRLWSVSYPYNVDSGAEFYGTKGKLFVSKRGKIEAFDDKKERIPLELEGMALKNPGPNHLQNWVDCAKTGATPNATLDKAFVTTTAVHLGNISTRLRRSLQFDGAKQEIVDDAEATALLGRKYREGGHWSVPT